MTKEKDLRAKWRPRHFAISTFSLGAGVTPAQGGVEPTVGSTTVEFLSSTLPLPPRDYLRCQRAIAVGAGRLRFVFEHG
jgi:hypothetical protein